MASKGLEISWRFGNAENGDRREFGNELLPIDSSLITFGVAFN